MKPGQLCLYVRQPNAEDIAAYERRCNTVFTESVLGIAVTIVQEKTFDWFSDIGYQIDSGDKLNSYALDYQLIPLSDPDMDMTENEREPVEESVN